MNAWRMAGMRDPTGTGVHCVLASKLSGVIEQLVVGMCAQTGTGVCCVSAFLKEYDDRHMVGMRYPTGTRYTESWRLERMCVADSWLACATRLTSECAMS
jgi:hypothetical protein